MRVGWFSRRENYNGEKEKQQKPKERENEQILLWVPPAVNKAIGREAKKRGMTRSGVVVAALLRQASIRGYAIEEAVR